MCGRFALTVSPKELEEALAVIDAGDFPPRYNIAPTQPILVVAAADRTDPRSNTPPRRTALVRWGFLPGWVKDPNDFPLLLNARAETAIEKASFRAAMRHRRVLVPASGFYEWRRHPKDSGLASQAYWIRPKSGGIVAFGGLMETWASADGSEMDTGAILTTRSNAAMAFIHDRMPVVIRPEDFARWLDCKTQEPRDVVDLMVPADDDLFDAVPVSDAVNKVANTTPDIQTPVSLAAPAEAPQRADRKKPAPAGPADEGDGPQLSLF
ncbi:SOS response-associated peptidase [Rhizobium sp. DKSPLA3]|uniref:Abasic site processing protein n=1 Tax=Rhizobium quercicola TaxID=2901226 RepID=A0A9X1NS20_9HYPH|nr:SOS response-associated peptidase [Rhizobium quercicola]MCD7109004.1 SOS response-associated peptidase [Rhizobium quercicola]